MTVSYSKMLTKQVSLILQETWKIRKGLKKVPSPESVLLTGGGVRFEGTVLYADLAHSSFLATDFQQRTAAKIIKCFLRCCTQLITKNKGTVTSFDGDRVMGVYMRQDQENRAVLTGLQINAAVTNILRPHLNDHFQSMVESPYDIDHCVGIDRGEVLAVRTGHAGSNDLAWIGRAPNLAAKLSDVRHSDYKTIITKDVYDALDTEYQQDDASQKSMWKEMTYPFLGVKQTIYTSGWYWRP